ncbi:hypothetical protein MMC08_008636 [Hypocenomyce scalaris]|nr:hypothetical protein [Hypocenomyce scalaris]
MSGIGILGKKYIYQEVSGKGSELRLTRPLRREAVWLERRSGETRNRKPKVSFDSFEKMGPTWWKAPKDSTAIGAMPVPEEGPAEKRIYKYRCLQSLELEIS